MLVQLLLLLLLPTVVSSLFFTFLYFSFKNPFYKYLTILETKLIYFFKGPKLQGVTNTLQLINYENNRTNEGTLWASNRFGEEGYVSDQWWSLVQAEVACQQLGYTFGAIGYTAGSLFRNASNHHNQIESMYAVECQGGELHIQDCSYSAIGSNKYQHGYSAGVICNGE